MDGLVGGGGVQRVCWLPSQIPTPMKFPYIHTLNMKIKLQCTGVRPYSLPRVCLYYIAQQGPEKEELVTDAFHCRDQICISPH